MGHGRPIVFLHGAFTTYSDWPPVILEAAASIGRAITIDRPGHGRSPRSRYQAGGRQQARQIAASLALDQPAIIVGHSFGALPALAFAEEFPEQTSALLLLAPICFPEWRAELVTLGPRAWPFLGPHLSAAAHAVMDKPYLALAHHQMFAPQPVPEDWEANYPIDQILTPDSFVREGEDAWAASPLGSGSYRMSPPKQPTTIIQGDADQIVIHGWHARMMEWIAPAVRVVWLKGVGHMLHQVAPDRVIEELARLANHDRTADQGAR